MVLETADVRRRCRLTWAHFCALLQFWTKKAGYSEGSTLYGGKRRETSYLAQYVMMRANSQTLNETIVTWRDVVKGTPWLDVWADFSLEPELALLQQSSADETSELERDGSLVGGFTRCETKPVDSQLLCRTPL